jgi:predicted MPP superfamily phosphohydrolase
MRSYSLFAIILLCLCILLIDALSFYWLQSILVLLESASLVAIINLAFWIFSIGLITAILVLKIRIDSITLKRKQLLVSSLYGLTVSSFIPKIIFVIGISVLYFSNYILTEEDSLLLVPLFGLLSGFLPFFVIAYAVFKAVYRFKIHRLHIQFESLPDDLSKLRIVHISDLHLGSFNFRYQILERAVKLINSLNPDFIFFTGDLVNNYAWELNGWVPVFNQLKSKMGKFAVLGNHDYGDYSSWDSEEDKKINFETIKSFYRDIGFTLLCNEAALVKKNTAQLALIGVENWGTPPFKRYGDLEKAMNEVTSIPFKILLSHDPSHWDEEVVRHTNIALTLSGHTHGMQVGFQLMGNQWSPIKYKYKRWGGLYSVNNQHLYVNRGLGWLGFPGRLGMRPEITFLKLEKGL